ncbi:uncharacterized protein LOC110848362 isoform X3 [Folsomia candida]|uniref:uncharacterized protein LOC110848362 isoform X3 n=1 Tax=Folsomia candida TaxID=158441 RepID=UPI000B8F962B|nr:uncharacterized protein LOC110848362 isoform X3 [Folsomia candida]
MSKKASKEAPASDSANHDGIPVDFILQTMLARASAPGKRQIRPKNVDALLNADIQELGSDEDPDFDVSEDKHHNESDLSIESELDDDDDDETGKGSMDGNVEDTDDEDDVSYDANNDPRQSLDTSDEGSDEDDEEDDSAGDEQSSEDDTDSQSPVQKRSALRDTLKKLNESEFSPQTSRKRKRPRKAGVANSQKRGGGGGKKDDAEGKSSKKPTKTNKKDSSAGDKSSQPRKKGGAGGASKKRKSVDEGDRSKSKDKIKAAAKRKKKSGVVDRQRTITEMVLSVEKSQKENRKELMVGSPICSACLGKASDEMNEIVECDSCGITVHEACYGVSDISSLSSGTGSSCSTEPWFCDACRCRTRANISCELCPMQGGLYKETTAGRWVHLVCALYTPGVIITDTGLPSLFEIPYAKWGAHPCSLCDDSRFARCGICIPCDAGMCKTYLHATCAQKHGLLSDPIQHALPGCELEADPYYAACKLHTNRETSKRRSKCFSILQEQLRIKQEQKLATDITPQERENQSRIRRKLERIRFKVAIKQAHIYTTQMSKNSSPSSSVPLTANNLNALSSNLLPPLPTLADTLPPSWKEGNKKPRILPTSAGTAMAMLRKATLMGLDVKSLELEDKHSRIATSVKKKWNIPPGLSVEYAAYYADRECRIAGLTQQCEKLEKENQQLNNKQIDLQNSYDMQSINNELMDEDTGSMRENLVGITSLLKTLCSPSNKKLVTSLQGIEAKTAIEEPPQRRRSPSHSNRRLSPAKTSIGSNKNASNKKSSSNSTSFSPPVQTISERLAIKTCSICDQSDEQPWIIRCDNCKKLYHMKCLDPPLTRMPKRSKLCGWMCSDCGEEELEAEEAEVDTEAPRTLRGRTKIRKPGKYRHSTDSKEGDLKIVCEVPEPDSSIIMLTNNLIKVETPAASAIPPLTNGSVNKPRKRKSESSTSTNLFSPVSNASGSHLNSSSAETTPKKPRKTKKQLQSEQNEHLSTTSQIEGHTPPLHVPVDGNSIPIASTPKPKKPRAPRKPKSIKTEDLVASPVIKDEQLSIISGELNPVVLETPIVITTPKKRPKTIKLEKTPKVAKVPKTPRTPKNGPSPKMKKKATLDSTTTVAQVDTSGLLHFPSVDSSNAAAVVIAKKKRIKKVKIKDEHQISSPQLSIEGSSGVDIGSGGSDLVSLFKRKPKKSRKALLADKSQISSFSSPQLNIEGGGGAGGGGNDLANFFQRKTKKPKKSLAELQKNMMAAATVAVKKGDEPGPVVLTNGKPKVTKRRKSSAAGIGGLGDADKDASIPPKKRKRITASLSIQANANQDATINAVASGAFDGYSIDEAQMNGISRPALPDGVLMQGSGWNNNTDADELMKGHAMGSNCSSSDVVTVNASDLIDCVLNTPLVTTTATVSGYSPGFYSNSPVTSSNPASTTVSSTVSPSNNFMINPTSTPIMDGELMGTNSSSQVSSWVQNPPTTQESQNVIKLIYEANDTTITTTCLDSPRMAAANYAPAQHVIVPPLNNTAAPPIVPKVPSSEYHRICFACNNEDLKKNMVTCDKCAQDYHFMCLTPPLMYSPRRRNYSWYCSACDEAGAESQAATQQNQNQKFNCFTNKDACGTTPCPI